MGKARQKALMKAAQAQAQNASNTGAGHTGQPVAKNSRKAKHIAKEERHKHKMEKRKKDKAKITASMWAGPAPAHLVGKLEIPKVKSKYQSYFEFAENTEKKKKLEFQVTNDTRPPPGFTFIPFGDPIMTNACKELSRERGAMIFIVSGSKEENSKISEFIHRTGCHFRESIVEEAREVVGDTVINHPTYKPGAIEPIPESQEEINKQADAAIKDLFPRIPNTDRQMIIEHAFQKGVLFHGDITVGLQANIPLSRRVQLAVLAHIRHTHTRYDKLLKETSWVNARKVVEPVCLDVLIKWRGDEETGRDQMDEILREVVIITDSEDEGDSDSDDETSEEEGEVSSASSPELVAQTTSRNQNLPAIPNARQGIRMDSLDQQTSREVRQDSPETISSRTRSRMKPQPQGAKRTQKGFKRYQAAWEDALHRQHDLSNPGREHRPGQPNNTASRYQPDMLSAPQYSRQTSTRPHESQGNHFVGSRRYVEYPTMQPERIYSPHIHPPDNMLHRNEVIVRKQPDHYINAGMQPHHGAPIQPYRENRPSQVVSGSSPRHSLQDMLVPSIESIPSDVTRPLQLFEDRRAESGNFDHRQESYARQVIESRRLSPPGRQFIVIDDDSPQNKRRRVMHDDSGHFRPLASCDYSTTSFADSHLPSSSIVPGHSSLGHSLSQNRPSPGLSRGPDSSFAMANGRSIPIYDVPDHGYIGRPPEHFRRTEVYDSAQPISGTTIRQITSTRPLSHASKVPQYRSVHDNRMEGAYRERISEDMHRSRPLGAEYRAPARGSGSPILPVSSRVSHSHDVASGRDVMDQAFIHNFSQSRINGPTYARDGYNVVEESRRGSMHDPQGFENQYEEQRGRLLPLSSRARSPARYIERPMYENEASRHPIRYEEYMHPVQHPRTPDQVPIFVRERTTRPLEPVPAPYRSRQEPVRRQIVVID